MNKINWSTVAALGIIVFLRLDWHDLHVADPSRFRRADCTRCGLAGAGGRQRDEPGCANACLPELWTRHAG